MSASRIPPRQPIGDPVEGCLLRAGDQTILSPVVLPDTQVIGEGSWIVRYGVVYLGKPHMSIVPGLLALDSGEIMQGEEAWHFLLHRSNLYPRADVIGYRNDGTDDMVVVKRLDLVQPLAILVYQHPEDTIPAAQVSAIITPDPAILVPRLAEYAPLFPTIAAWRRTLP